MDRPIIFDGESVRAILAGTKTQTRRVVKPQPTLTPCGGLDFPSPGLSIPQAFGGGRLPLDNCFGNGLPSRTEDQCCPYGRPGDELWVRETWAVEDASKLKLPEYCGGGNPDWIYYRDPVHIGTGLTWRSPIHMPRWASRITLRVTDVRVERVQEITKEGAKAEAYPMPRLQRTAYEARQGKETVPDDERGDFRYFWDRSNANRGFGWDVNPWVWVVSFERVAPTE